MDAKVVYEVGKVIELALDEVKVYPFLNPRQGALDQALIMEYAENLDDIRDPMHAFYLDGELVLTGGFHRYAAHELAGRLKGEFFIAGRSASRDDAQEDADLDNLRHGLNYSRAEKREVMKRHVKRHPEYSDVRLAKQLRATDKTIRSIREELEAASEIPILDTLIGVDGIPRPRSIERPPRQDPQAEAEELMTPLEEAIERAKAEGQEVFQANPCPDCLNDEFYWSSPETVECTVCGRTWDKSGWIHRITYGSGTAALDTAEAEPAPASPTVGPQAWQQFVATPPLAPVIGAEVTGQGEPAAEEPEWLSEAEDSQPALATPGTQAEAPAAKTDWGQPVKEFKSTAPAPPPPAPKLPPPPPPVIGRAPLSLSITVYPNGNALIVERKGETGMSSKSVQVSAVAVEIQQLVDGYLSKEETANVNPV